MGMWCVWLQVALAENISTPKPALFGLILLQNWQIFLTHSSLGLFPPMWDPADH